MHIVHVSACVPRLSTVPTTVNNKIPLQSRRTATPSLRRVSASFGERLRDYLNENCHRCGSATGWATEETWTESTVFVVFIFIFILRTQSCPTLWKMFLGLNNAHTQLYLTFYIYKIFICKIQGWEITGYLSRCYHHLRITFQKNGTIPRAAMRCSYMVTFPSLVRVFTLYLSIYKRQYAYTERTQTIDRTLCSICVCPKDGLQHFLGISNCFALWTHRA